MKDQRTPEQKLQDVRRAHMCVGDVVYVTGANETRVRGEVTDIFGGQYAVNVATDDGQILQFVPRHQMTWNFQACYWEADLPEQQFIAAAPEAPAATTILGLPVPMLDECGSSDNRIAEIEDQLLALAKEYFRYYLASEALGMREDAKDE